MNEYDAVLKNWDISGTTVTGDIYFDRKARFEDGHNVRTSSLMGGPNINGIILTRNTVYKLEPYPKISNPHLS